MDWIADSSFLGDGADYQQLTRKMVVEKFKEEEAEKNALSPASSRASVGYGSGSGQDDVSVSA
jgi:hypothetical protein